jgi:hypothetical protein
MVRSYRKRSMKKSPKQKRSYRKRSMKKSPKQKRSYGKRSMKKSPKQKRSYRKRSMKKSVRKYRVSGFTKTYSYPYAGRKLTNLTADEIRRQYLQVGRAWEKHTKKQQDLGAANTTARMRSRLAFWYSKKGEIQWIEYSMPNNVYSAYKSGAKLMLA